MAYGPKAFEKPDYPESSWQYNMERLIDARKYKEFFSYNYGIDWRYAEKLSLLQSFAALHGWGRKKFKEAREPGFFSDMYVGKIVFFGHDRWNHLLQPCRILEIQPDRMLLQSVWGWSSASEHRKNWDESLARKWLNGEYFENVFTKEERKCILKTEVITEPSPLTMDPALPNGGAVKVKPTKDYCFLLSLEEHAKYYGIDLTAGFQMEYNYRMHHWGRVGDHHYDYESDEWVRVHYLGKSLDLPRMSDYKDGIIFRTPGQTDGHYLVMIGDYLFYRGELGYWFSDFKIPFYRYPAFWVSLRP